MKRNFRHKMIAALCLTGLSFFTFNASADPVDAATAKKVAFTKLKQITSGTVTTRSAEGMELIYQAGTLVKNPYFYVFNSNDNFVIVAGDDKAMPVLGYSEHGTFDPNNIPPNMAQFLKGYEEEIKYVRTVNNVTTRSSELKSMWEKMINGEIDQDTEQSSGNNQTLLDKGANNLRSYSTGTSLIKTQWGQLGITYMYSNGSTKTVPLYNKYCPSYYPTGCVATAMGQIIKYWGYDKNYEYNYDKMPDKLSESSTTEQIDEVARLLYDCGISVNMQYKSNGSSSYPKDAADAFKSFGYNNAEYKVKSQKYIQTTTYGDGRKETETITKTFYNDQQWIDLIKGEIDSERPVIYAGQGSKGGHAFICDGYKNDNTFHINWGWDGQYDNFFLLSALNPDTYDFNNDCEAIINIKPQKVSNVNVKSVSVSPDKASIKIGETVTLSETVAPSNATNKNVTWSSDNTSVATVNSSGTVKGVKAGTANITVTTKDGGHTAKCVVTVIDPNVKVTGVSLDYNSLSLEAGKNYTLKATVAPANATNKNVTWSSDNTSVATVNSSGTVKGVKAGTANITVTTKDGGHTAKCVVTVNEVKEITVGNQTKMNLPVSLSDESDKKVTWTSSNPSIATVDANGVITPRKEGTVTITAKSQGSGRSAIFVLTVYSATGVEDVQSPSVWAYGNKLYVSTPVATDIRIYSLSGALVHQTKIPEGQYTKEMNSGTYIVTVGNNNPIKVFIR